MLPKMDDGTPSARDLDIYWQTVRGKSQRVVGEEYGITQARVSQICDAVDTHLFPLHQERIRLLKSRQTASLMHIYGEAIAAWERSQKEYLSVTEEESTTTAGQNPGATSKSSRTKRAQVGGAQYLAEARAALADIRKIWAVEAPVAEVDDEADGPRVAGIGLREGRDQWLREQIEAMQKMLAAPDN